MALACIPAAHSGAASLSENFDGPGAPGWLVKNNSTSPSGTYGWGFGNASVFPAYNGAPGSYLSVNYQSTTAVSGGTISNWLMTPRMFGLSEGDTISFYTRKPTASFPDRLEVRMSTNGSCDPGTSEADVGDFETLLVSINPTLVTGGYPTTWTRYEVTLPPMTPGRGCVAFRYYVTNAGSSAPNSDYIGIDQVDVVDRAGDITPDTTIETGPAGTVGPEAAAFTYAGTPSDGVASYECRLISAAEPDPELASCPTAGQEYEGLAAGEYTFEARAVSVDGNVDPTPATREFTVDATAPDTSISSGPEGLVGSADATFTYDGDPSADVAGFECRLTPEGATPTAFATCPGAGRDYAGLVDGTYVFEVRAVDAVGNVDPTPATRTFTVDTTPPDTEIVSGPEGLVADGDVAFAYSSVVEESGVTFECRMVGPDAADPEFAGCPVTGESYDLAEGAYRFEVRATDAVGNGDPTPATREFTVDTTAPDTTITGGPDGPTGSADVTFTYEGTPADDTDRFECRLRTADDDDPVFASCPDEGRTYSELADGTYTFEVRAIDAVDNTDMTPASEAFTVDATAPTVTIATGPAASSTATSAVFAYDASPTSDVDVVECRLIRPDDADPAFAACSSTATTYEGLTVGAYRFELRARDAVGNVSAVADWTFAVEAPAAPPAEPTPPTTVGRTPLPTVELPPPAAPQVSGLRLERSVFRAWSSGRSFGFARDARVTGDRGSWLRFSLDRAAAVELRISRSVKRRWQPVRGVITRRAHAGNNRVPVHGRFRGVTLRPGTYRLSVTVIDRSSGAKTTTLRTFRIKG